MSDDFFKKLDEEDAFRTLAAKKGLPVDRAPVFAPVMKNEKGEPIDGPTQPFLAMGYPQPPKREPGMSDSDYQQLIMDTYNWESDFNRDMEFCKKFNLVSGQTVQEFFESDEGEARYHALPEKDKLELWRIFFKRLYGAYDPNRPTRWRYEFHKELNIQLAKRKMPTEPPHFDEGQTPCPRPKQWRNLPVMLPHEADAYLAEMKKQPLQTADKRNSKPLSISLQNRLKGSTGPKPPQIGR